MYSVEAFTWLLEMCSDFFSAILSENKTVQRGKNACLVCVSLTGLLLLDGRKEATVLVELRHRKKNISVQL